MRLGVSLHFSVVSRSVEEAIDETNIDRSYGAVSGESGLVWFVGPVGTRICGLDSTMGQQSEQPSDATECYCGY